MTPSQLYKQESQNGKLKAEIKEMLRAKALSRYEAEELLQLNVLNEIERPRKINQKEIRRVKENHNMTPKEKLDTISHLYTLNGFKVVQRDRLGIKLFKKKKFSYLHAVLWFLLLGVGLVIYVLYYLLRGDDNVSIDIEDNYKVKPEFIDEEVIEIIEEELEEVEEEPQEEIHDSGENTQESSETNIEEGEENELLETTEQEEVLEVKEKTQEEKLIEELTKEEK